MGLDLVELVMRVEEEFEIEIPDVEAEKMITPKHVIDYVIKQPNVRNKRLPRDLIASEVWEMIEDEGGVTRNDFDENSHFIEDMGMD